jgi:DMSO/TMAO reductase YedYZ molybdopterin-dependent catalytic subunit
MLKSKKVLMITLVMILVLSQVAVFAEDSEPIVNISGEGIASEVSFTLDQLKAMPEAAQVEETYVYNSKSGEKSVLVKGVRLAYILEDLLLAENQGEVNFTASDDWPIDPQPLSDVMDETLQYVLAYEVDGEKIDEDENPDNDEIIVYRKVKETGEFGTVYKMIVDINVSGPIVQPTVTITGDTLDETLEYTLEELMAMPEEAQINEEYIYNTKVQEKSVVVEGVSLAYILETAGITSDAALQVTFTASDGYQIEPQPISDVLSNDKQYVLAYKIDGEVIDEDENPDNSEVTVYKKVETPGERNTVYKMIETIELNPIETVVDVEAANFTDITEAFTYAQTAINTLAENGIVNGIGDNQYAPEQSFTRGEFAKIMILALGYEPVQYKGDFSDVSAEDWEADYVQGAVDNGIFTGYPDGTFRPDAIITRQEIAAVTARGAVTLGLVSQEKLDKFVMEKSNYLDKDSVPEWAENEVAWLEAEGIFEDFIVESFEPTVAVDRAQAAVVVYKTLMQE